MAATVTALSILAGCAGGGPGSEGVEGRRGLDDPDARLWFYGGYSGPEEWEVDPPIGRIVTNVYPLRDGRVFAVHDGMIEIFGKVEVWRQVERQVIFPCEVRDRNDFPVEGSQIMVVYPGTYPGCEPLGARKVEGLPTALVEDLDALREGKVLVESPAEPHEYPVEIDWQLITSMDRRWRSEDDLDVVHQSGKVDHSQSEDGRFRITLPRELLEKIYAVPVSRYQLLVRVKPRDWKPEQLHPRSSNHLVVALKDSILREDVLEALEGGS